MDDIAKIAAGLSEAQRAFIRCALETRDGRFKLPAYVYGRRVQIRTIANCKRLGITDGAYPPHQWLTPIGQQVRTYLENSK